MVAGESLRGGLSRAGSGPGARPGILFRRNCGLEAGCSPGQLGFRPQPLRKHPSLVLNCFRSAQVSSSGAVEDMRGKARVVVAKAYGFRSYKFCELAPCQALADWPQHGHGLTPAF